MSLDNHRFACRWIVERFEVVYSQFNPECRDNEPDAKHVCNFVEIFNRRKLSNIEDNQAFPLWSDFNKYRYVSRYSRETPYNRVKNAPSRIHAAVKW